METRRANFPTSIGPGEGIAALGAIVVIVSMLLNWLDFSQTVQGRHLTQQVTASGVPVKFLWNYTTASNNPSLLIVLIPVVVVCLAGILFVKARWLTLLGGLVAGAVGLMYIFQLHQKIRADRAVLGGFGLSDFLGIAPIICIVGGAAVLIGGILLLVRGSAAA